MRILFTILISSVLISCHSTEDSTIDKESVITDINAKMAEQESAWNRGDLEAFMSHYWKSDSLSFIGKSGLNKGWQKTLDNYKRSYPNKDAMGMLVFENKEFKALGNEAMLVIGKWTLYRSLDTLGGHYSLIWEPINDNWQITSDHSS